MRTLFLTAAALVLYGSAAVAAPSSFQRSCEDIQLEIDGDGLYMVAQCRDKQGRLKGAQLEVIGYQNIDGVLKRQGYNPSSFQRSCDQYWLDIGQQKVMLHANCRKKNGSYRATRIELQGIHNDDGNLTSDGY